MPSNGQDKVTSIIYLITLHIFSLLRMQTKVHIALSQLDILFETICRFLVIMIWIVTIVGYPTLPAIIPIHFSLLGEADGFGSKEHIWLYPSVITILHIGLTTINNYPHTFNLTDNSQTKNTELQLKKITKIIRTLKLAVITFLSGILFYTFIII